MTTSPSWFPAWPSSFPDIGAVYDQTIRRQFGTLYDNADSGEYKDVGAIAEVLSVAAAQATMWIRQRLLATDPNGLFLDLWEDTFGLSPAGGTTARWDRILRAARHTLGTATKSTMQAIFAPIFGFAGDSDRIAFASPSAAAIITADPDTEDQWARATNCLHIYDSLETADPAVPDALSAIDAAKGAQQEVSVGRYRTCTYGNDGGYGTACYDGS